MIDKIKRLLAIFLNTDPKKLYLETLQRIDFDNPSMTELPLIVCGFWHQLNLKHLRPAMSYKAMMSHEVSTRTKNIDELIYILDTATNAIAQDDHDTLVDISVTQCNTITKQTLDDYFSDKNSHNVSYTDGIERLHKSVKRHLDVIENYDSKTYCRLLSKVYNELYGFTWTIIITMPSKE